jgi:hypothetical protein
MLIMEAIGPRGEELAMAAGAARDIAVGWDGEFNSATFDADGIDDSELEAVIVEELDDQEPDWRSHLKLVD